MVKFAARADNAVTEARGETLHDPPRLFNSFIELDTWLLELTPAIHDRLS